ncbi:MAG TPA: patatin-like phospholipase family protein [Hyphomicrobiaceae bacterium]|nr:patatin-like phospholipase family protein [Hyphomicrobiaceae bacterium]
MSPIRPSPKPLLHPGRPSIALALGSGGARGLAHILVMELFDELGLRPKVIAGTSIGALYGAAYAAGLSAASIRAVTEETLGARFDLARQLFAARAEPVQKVLRLLPVRSALLDPQSLLDLLVADLLPKDFSGLQTPLKVVATDFEMREAVVLTEGPLRPAIAASIAIPVIFSPVRLGGRVLVDGGLVNPLPFELVAGEADITVAVDVSGAATGSGARRQSAVDVLMRSVQILEKSITREKLKSLQPDIYVDVSIEFNALEFYKPREILAAAAPAKVALRRQLERVIASETVEAAAAVPPEPQSPPGKGLRRGLLRRRRRDGS